MNQTHAGVPIIEGGAGPRTAPPKVRIMVAIPTLKWACTSGIADFFMTLGYLTYMPGSPWAFDSCISSGSSTFSFPGDFQRNLLVKKFLESKCDWIWFIDSDELPSDNSLELLKLLPKGDAIAGIYPIPARNEAIPVAWSVYDLHPEGFMLTDISRDGEIIEGAGGAATGCMLIHRRVFEDPKMCRDSSLDPPSWFKIDRKENGEPTNTEDMAFCRRLHECGYKLVVHTGVRWGHVKTDDVTKTQEAMDVAFAAGVRYGLARDPAFCSPEQVGQPNGADVDAARVAAPASVA